MEVKTDVRTEDLEIYVAFDRLAKEIVRDVEGNVRSWSSFEEAQAFVLRTDHRVAVRVPLPRGNDDPFAAEVVTDARWGTPDRTIKVDDMNGETWDVSIEHGHGYFKAWTSEPGDFGDGPGRDWVYIQDPNSITILEQDGSEAVASLGAVRACMMAAGWHMARSEASLARAMENQSKDADGGSVSEVWAIYAADGDLCGAAQNKGLAEHEASNMDDERPHHAPHTVRRFVAPAECRSVAPSFGRIAGGFREGGASDDFFVPPDGHYNLVVQVKSGSDPCPLYWNDVEIRPKNTEQDPKG